MRSPFGRLHGRNLEIVAVAEMIGRTPSALAMKACNFASLDPVFRSSQRKGLSGASDADRAIWNEFTANPEKVAAEAEEQFSRTDAGAMERNETIPVAPAGDTEVERVIRARRVQSFFRAAVLTSYEGQCAISGLAIPDILVASHIIPWSESVERRADPLELPAAEHPHLRRPLELVLALSPYAKNGRTDKLIILSKRVIGGQHDDLIGRDEVLNLIAHSRD